MLITRKSRLTGLTHTLEVPCTEDQLAQWQAGTLIQNTMPDVPLDLREFLITGITPAEWQATFGTHD